NREIMMNFYQPLKACSDKIEFFFMTGVSKFTRAGIFSQLNNLTDITINEKYNNLVGYSETELRTNFMEPLHLCFERDNTRFSNKYKDFEDFMVEVKRWYNGYNWGGNDTLYNPTSIYLFLTNQRFSNFWFETGTPTFLFTLAKLNSEIGIENLNISESQISSFEIDNISLQAILFQAGYLTINKILHDGFISLRFPNFEVERSYLTFIINSIGSQDLYLKKANVYSLLNDAFENNDLTKVFDIANTVVANATSLIYLKPNEYLYNAIFYLVFKIFGISVASEVCTDRGRMDAVIYCTNTIYIIEFKLNETAQKALSQINKKNYTSKFSLDKRNIVLVGVSVDKETYTIKEFEAQNLMEN
ncbi:MAG: AAA family ATPase, partial [Sediminibacterium sp.]|nr:AAA family ATPase [Sediminibacterium sp.]